MIKTFKSRETERIFSRQRSDRIPEEVQRIALRHLRTLDQSVAVQDSWLPMPNGAAGVSLYSVAIDEQWRICFEWREGQIYNVEVLDGHCG